jgi:quercetin dioxygenase-like cupin family protein
MSRAHVEFVEDGELEWRRERLSGELPEVRNKLLSVDDGTGAFTRLVELGAGWSAPSATFPTVQELYVLAGSLAVDGRGLSSGSYLRIPGDAPVDIEVEADCRLLWTSDSALDAPGDHDGHRFWTAPESEPTAVDATAMEWKATGKEGPEEGLAVKYLWADDETGAVTFLARASDWTEPRQEHHDCVETSYVLSGGIELGERGTMTEGDYFWRPPWVRHGPMTPLDEGFEAFMRVDRPLVNHYTSVEGVPLNY